MMKKRVVVAMSGGVDSSVSALLLKEAGYEVIGASMSFSGPAIPGFSHNTEDARRAAQSIGIKHFVWDMHEDFGERVVNDFCSEYIRGRTPNPCITCNRHIKFGSMLKRCLQMKADFLATGHHARKKDVDTPSGRKTLLLKARDLSKDQSYFLYTLGQRQLKRALFPVGEYTKSEIRGIASRNGLSAAGKPDSQEICFLSGKSYRQFLQERFPGRFKSGAVVDTAGNLLGSHEGVAFYTIGQREGLGISAGERLYIIAINHRANRITVGAREQVFQREFLAHKLCLAYPAAGKKKIVATVKIRYNHKEAPASITICRGQCRVVFKEPQFAITCGQSAVFYEGEAVLGGGVIRKVLR